MQRRLQMLIKLHISHRNANGIIEQSSPQRMHHTFHGYTNLWGYLNFLEYP